MSRHPVDEVRAGLLTISGDAAHHLRHVLRARAGDAIVVFDAAGREAEAVIATVGKSEIVVEAGLPRLISRESPLALTLAFALSKGDKPEWIVQKAVELGAHRLLVFAAARSVARWPAGDVVRKTERLAAVIRGAAAQCGRNVLPPLTYAASLSVAMADLAACPQRIALHPEAVTPLVAAVTPGAGAVALLCGPEGGLAPEEAAALTDAGWRLAKLGPRILRAETATLAALAALQSRWGDFGAV